MYKLFEAFINCVVVDIIDVSDLLCFSSELVCAVLMKTIQRNSNRNPYTYQVFAENVHVNKKCANKNRLSWSKTKTKPNINQFWMAKVNRRFYVTEFKGVVIRHYLAHIIIYNSRLCQSISYDIWRNKIRMKTITHEKILERNPLHWTCTHTWVRSRSRIGFAMHALFYAKYSQLYSIWPFARQLISESGWFSFYSIFCLLSILWFFALFCVFYL